MFYCQARFRKQNALLRSHIWRAAVVVELVIIRTYDSKLISGATRNFLDFRDLAARILSSRCLFYLFSLEKAEMHICTKQINCTTYEPTYLERVIYIN